MPRQITQAFEDESGKATGAKPVEFVKLEFDSGPQRCWSGLGDFTFDGEVYQGVGNLGEITVAQEGVEVRDYSVTFRLSGVDAATVNRALNEDVQGRRATWWRGFLDDGYRLVDDPIIAFKGRMDTIDASLGEVGEVVVTAVSPVADWNVAREHLFTDADQQEQFPGDLGFEYVNETVEKEIVWAGHPISDLMPSNEGSERGGHDLPDSGPSTR